MTDWQEDWSPETGMTGICPKCSSGEVVSLPVDPRSPALPDFYWFCENCGFEERE